MGRSAEVGELLVATEAIERKVLYWLVNGVFASVQVARATKAMAPEWFSGARADIVRVAQLVFHPDEIPPMTQTGLHDLWLFPERVLGREPQPSKEAYISEVHTIDATGDALALAGNVDGMDAAFLPEWLALLENSYRYRALERTAFAVTDVLKTEVPIKGAESLLPFVDFLRQECETQVDRSLLNGQAASTGALAYIDALADDPKPPVAFGLPRLDEGFVMLPGTLSVLAGPRKAGKTQFLVNRMLYLASIREPCLFFSLEMTEKQVHARIVGNVADTDYMRYEMGLADSNEQMWAARQVVDAAPWLHHLVIDARKGLTPDDLAATIMAWKVRRKLRFVAIDYDTLVAMPRGGNMNMAERTERLYDVLANIAKRLDVAVVVLAQLKNEAIGKLSPAAEDIYGGVNASAKADAVLILNAPTDAGFEAGSVAAHDGKLLRLRVDVQRSGRSHRATWLAADLARIKFCELSDADVNYLEDKMREQRKKRREA